MEIKEKIRTQDRNYAPASVRAIPQQSDDSDEFLRVEVVFATGHPVKRLDWDSWKYFNEVLEISEKAINAERLANAPVLDSHSRYSTSSQVGVVESWSIEKGEAKAVLRISNRTELEGLRQDLRDGILRNISVGYTVQRYKQEDSDVDLPTYTATAWTPIEISIVPVPADPSSTVQGMRSEHGEPALSDVTIWPRAEKNNMDTNQTTPPTLDAEAIRAAEQARISDLRRAARAAAIGEDVLDAWIAEGISADEGRARALAHIEATQKKVIPSAPTVANERDEERQVEQARAIEQAIELRSGLRIANQSQLLGEFAGMSMLRMAETMLREKGVRTDRMSDNEIARAALGLTRTHTSGDFPLILENMLNKRLRASYDEAMPTFQAWTQQGSRTDYKTGSATSLSGFDSLEKVKEGAEITAGTLKESAEKYAVEKYGKVLLVTSEMLVNDDLGAFARIPQRFAAAAVRTHNEIVYGILTANEKMSDGVALFHANHGNLAGTGTAITVDALAAARAAMRKQTDQNKQKIYGTPAFLIVSPDKETEAQQLIQATIVATKDSDTNPFKGSLQIIVDPHLTGNAWYVAASNIDTIEYSYLDGQPFRVAQWEDYARDSLGFSIIAPFGAKAVDWRGLYKNPGA